MAYKAALDQKGIPNRLFPVEGVGHGFAPLTLVDIVRSKFVKQADWRKAFTEWANAIFGEK